MIKFYNLLNLLTKQFTNYNLIRKSTNIIAVEKQININWSTNTCFSIFKILRVSFFFKVFKYKFCLIWK